MLITNVTCPTSKYPIKCPDVTNKDGICVHNTANDASAMSEVSYMLGNNNKVSFHVAVDNYRVVTGLPFDRSCFASGDGRYGAGNAHKIHIEICYSKSGGQNFEESENMASAYIALLLRQYGWGIDRVFKHQDFANKYCPHRTLDMGWERFLNKIRTHLGLQAQPAPQVNGGGSFDMAKVYQNGSTPEPVYMDTSLKTRIGCLNPREQCDCLAIDNDRPLVRYTVDGTNKKKCGYVLWKGGVK